MKNHYYRIYNLLYHNKKRKKYIYSYSFCLNPNQFQPSGAINFSDLNTLFHLILVIILQIL